MSSYWGPIFSAALGGGLVVKLLDILWSHYVRITDKKSSSKKIIDKHIDPILKAGDQLLGEITSLARKDFKPAYEINQSADIERCYSAYLFAQFWALLEVLRRVSINVNLKERKDGGMLIKFVAALHAKKNRIVTRAEQQAIADAIIKTKSAAYQILTFFEYLQIYKKENNALLNEIMKPLTEKLLATKKKNIRQEFLRYGMIIHSMLDTLDAKHVYIRPRKPYTNKLSHATQCDLEKRIFRVYLPNVKNSKQYWWKEK